jgi:hypothetical protein
MKSEDKQISLTDPDARSMATSGKDTGIVGYNVQAAVDTKNHIIVAHEVTNIGTDRHQLSNMAERARTEMGVETLDAVADRGYYASEEIRACEEAGITVTLPKPMTSNSKAKGRFGKQDFVYIAADDVYICPARERLTYRATTNDAGKMIRRYWTSACRACALKSKCTPEATRRVSRWEHEAVLETVQARLDHHPEKMTIRRQTAEHPFGTIKCWMGATHYEAATESGNRDGAQCARLQHKARDGAHRRSWAAGGLGDLSRRMLRSQIKAGRRPEIVWGGQRVDSAQIGVP